MKYYNIILKFIYDNNDHKKLNLNKNDQYNFIKSKITNIIEDLTYYQFVYDVSNISFNKNMELSFILNIKESISDSLLDDAFQKTSNINDADIKSNINDSIRASNKSDLIYHLSNSELFGLFTISIKSIKPASSIKPTNSNLISPPPQTQIRKTPSGYSYNSIQTDIKCKFKGTEPSPKGLGLCARMLIEGEKSKGLDGNIWIKSGGRWVKYKKLSKYNTIKKIPTLKVKKSLIDKTREYTLQLKLVLDKGEVMPNPIKSKLFLNSKIKSIMNNLIDVHIQDNVTININMRNAIILYKFHYTKTQLDKNKVYYNEAVRDTEGNLELDTDDFIRTIYDSKLVDGKLKGFKTHKKWNLDDYWKDIKLLVKRATPSKPSSKKVCPTGKVLNPVTNRCVKSATPSNRVKVVKPSTPSKQSSKKVCPTGKVLNPVTNRCVKSATPSNRVKVVKPSTPSKPAKLTLKINGIMLAHTFKDHKSGKIRAAPNGYTKAPDGWYASEKYDGYRAIWNGKDFVSRNGNIFLAPKSFKRWLPEDTALDGELFIGRESFEKHGLLRRKDVAENAWEKAKVKYQIFDSPSIDGDFEVRQSKIKKIISDSCKNNKGVCPLKYTTQKKIKNELELYNMFDKLVGKGAEGIMLRSPHSPYEGKRSSHLLKVKQLFDDECKIVGHNKGTGKYSNMLGAFKCELIKNPKIKFNISGMDDSIRTNYLKTHPIGTTVTFTYMGLSAKGVPRHPNYLRIRK